MGASEKQASKQAAYINVTVDLINWLGIGGDVLFGGAGGGVVVDLICHDKGLFFLR